MKYWKIERLGLKVERPETEEGRRKRSTTDFLFSLFDSQHSMFIIGRLKKSECRRHGLFSSQPF
ncbi:MAG: hypothetical protein C0433_02350 [Cyclobacterium sp.]|nr:hypothetical protein [Cyclobacterium sp.]